MKGENDVITQLIFEDLKFHQFLNALEAMDIVLEYQPDFAALVARQMGISFGGIPDEWIETYHYYMVKSGQCGYHDKEELMIVARECGEVLCNQI